MKNRARIIEYGSDHWILHMDGAIERPGRVTPDAKTWRIVGAVRFNNFGRIVECASVADIFAGRVTQWRYKNGAQRWYVRDFDHGTVRQWNSPRYSIK